MKCAKTTNALMKFGHSVCFHGDFHPCTIHHVVFAVSPKGLHINCLHSRLLNQREKEKKTHSAIFMMKTKLKKLLGGLSGKQFGKYRNSSCCEPSKTILRQRTSSSGTYTELAPSMGSVIFPPLKRVRSVITHRRLQSAQKASITSCF